jgi:predicted O-linked N-acetylglucosamine transferase (SPINDLY family)
MSHRDDAAAALGRRDWPAVETACRAALAEDPATAWALMLMAELASARGRHDLVLALLTEVRRHDPAYGEALARRAVATHLQGRQRDALPLYRAALVFDPANAALWSNCGAAGQGASLLAPALSAYRRATHADPGNADAWANCGALANELGHHREGVAALDRAVSLIPDRLGLRYSRLIAALPVVYEDEAGVTAARADYDRALAALERSVEAADAPHLVELAEAVDLATPFLLAYQGENDRDLQNRLGDVIARAMAARRPDVGTHLARWDGQEKIRIGFVTNCFKWHSVWKIPLRGWFAGLDRERFAVYGYHLGADRDAITVEAAGLATKFVQGPRRFDDWVAAIGADRPHVLVYPEIGMDPTALRLAALRLAPVQATTYGHPTTPGLPTIDLNLSCALMEPAGPERHYREDLVRLPGIGLSYAPPAIVPAAVTRAQIGLAEGVPAFWCCQMLAKYLPRHDELFPLIARAAGPCRFVFVSYPRGHAVTATFYSRLERAFAAHGLNAADYCLVLPPQTPERFHGIAGLCDIFLDAHGWSGCNTVMESLNAGLPVVTWPGETMRSRHAAGILARMGITETTAASRDEYIALAATLARDPARRAAIGARMRAAAPLAYDDPAVMPALADALIARLS